MAHLAELDEEGYLIEPMAWSGDIARWLGLQETVSLTGDHCDAIRFMRPCYADHRIAADVRHVMKHLARRLGAGSRNAEFELFPHGCVKQACRIPGMKRHRGWSTG